MKSKMMRVTGLLLVVALLSTCILSGTFAKYTTTGSGLAKIPVAKWGVTVANEIQALSSGYNGQGERVVTSDAMAPGHSIDITKPVLAGTPEVATKVTYKLDEFKLNKTVVDDSGVPYMPFSVTVFRKDGSNKWSWVTEIKASDYVSGNTFNMDAFCAAVNAKLEEARNANGKFYAVGTDLSTIDDDITIRVRWIDSGNDAMDTKLGNKDGLLVRVGISATVEQYYQE